jgi:hypothetical protein
MTGTVIASFALDPVPVAMLCLGRKSAGGLGTAATWCRAFAAREDSQSARYRRINHPSVSCKACRERLETRHRNCESLSFAGKEIVDGKKIHSRAAR